ncbi:MAG: mandelate racemase/muconate lactonizing enzyme family protein, partial [Bryobacteraceae bacterium]
MPKHERPRISRRGLLKTSAALLGGGMLGAGAKAAPEPPFQNVNTHSSPATLKITDLRVATVRKPGPSPCTIIRLDTNQGVYGLGEVRDGASATYALFLKSRVIGENPLRITYIFEKIKQFGGHARQAGGVVAIEEALWDIAGKVYGVPIYQMLGGKFRDKIRIYADTEESEDVQEYARRLKIRKDEMGLTWLKMDLGIQMVAKTPGTVTM